MNEFGSPIGVPDVGLDTGFDEPPMPDDPIPFP